MKKFRGNTLAMMLVIAGIVLLGAVPALTQVTNVDTGETFTTIQAAINDSDTVNGNTITVATGTYNEFVTVDKSLTILGESGAVLEGTGTGNAFLIKGADITINGFEIRNYAIGIRSYGGPGNYGDLVVRNANIHNNTQNGMLLVYDTFSAVSLESCTIANNVQNGIGIANGATLGALNMNDTLVTGNQSSGIYIASSGTTINGGSIENTTMSSNRYQGFFIENGVALNDLTISGGALEGNQFGIVTKTSTIHNLVITGVVVQNNTGSGLTFTGTIDGLTVEGCVFEGNPWEHVDLGLTWMGSANLTDVLIQGNLFKDGPWTSISIQGATFGVGDVIVTENEFLKPWSFGIQNSTGTLVLAPNNWWGSNIGPTIYWASVTYTSGAVAFSPWLGTPTSETTWIFIVDDRGDLPPGGYLQPALNAARDGDTVYVRAGAYETQGLISSSIVLQGEPGASIKSPGSTTYTIAESSQTWDPIIFAYGGTMTGDHVSGSGVISTHIKDLDIDGQNNAQAAPVRFVGILYRNADGEISGNTIRNMYDADGKGNGPETFGILVYGDSTVDILNNTISDYSRGGIGVQGDLGAAPDPVATVQGNTLIGNGFEAETGWWADNGIQFGYGASGQIIGNTVTGHWSNSAWGASGIIIVSTANVDIIQNLVQDNELGIALAGYGGYYGAPYEATDNILVRQNEIIANEYGISLQMDANNTLILMNNVTGNTVGISIADYYGIEAIGTQIHYNSITGNILGVENWEVDSDIDASLNWWGALNGPTADLDGDGTPDYVGGGDGIYGNVIFSPWLGLAPDGDPAQWGVQITGPMLIIVAPVGPEPTTANGNTGYFDQAVWGSNELPGIDTIEVQHGTYDASEPITQAVNLVSQPGSALHTTLNGDMSINGNGVLVGLPLQGFRMNGDVTVGAGNDAGTSWIHWCDLYGNVTNNGTGTFDAQYNYWGTLLESVVDARTTGLIDYEPFLPKNADDSYVDATAIIAAGLASGIDPAIDQLWLMVQLGQDVNTFIGYAGVAGAGAFAGAPAGAAINLGGAAGGGGAVEGAISGTYAPGEPIDGRFTLTDPVTGEPVTDAAVTTSLLGPDGALVSWGCATYDETTGEYVFSIDTSGLSPGTYELIIQTDDGQSKTVSIEVLGV